MTGVFSEIVEITAPSNAVAGSVVSVLVKIKNISAIIRAFWCLATADTDLRAINYGIWVGPGVTETWSGSFIMPNQDIILNVYSFLMIDGIIQFPEDDSKTKSIKLPIVLVPTVTEFKIFDYLKV